MWLYYHLFSQSSIDGHLSDLRFGVSTNKVARNTHVQVFVWAYAFISFEVNIQE